MVTFSHGRENLLSLPAFLLHDVQHLAQELSQAFYRQTKKLGSPPRWATENWEAARDHRHKTECIQKQSYFPRGQKKIEARVGRDMSWRGEGVAQESEKYMKNAVMDLIWKDTGI